PKTRTKSMPAQELPMSQLPMELWSYRHGRTNRNVASAQFDEGNVSMRSLFINQPSSIAELTDEGIMQIQRTRAWLIKNQIQFNRFYTSTYVRALQTVEHLKLPGAHWKPEDLLKERSNGDLERKSPDERKAFLKTLSNKPHLHDLFNFRPPNGESFADAEVRWRLFIELLRQECKPTDRVLVVTHAGMMWVERKIEEEWAPGEFQRHRGRASHLRMPNGMFLRYTRQNPRNPQDIRPQFGWFQTFCPQLGKEPGRWHRIKRRLFTTDEIADMADARLRAAKAIQRKEEMQAH
ncbi:MAG TPA: histidine phosphatase family protein, partial [Candidatus Paceibacterota bacterium]